MGEVAGTRVWVSDPVVAWRRGIVEERHDCGGGAHQFRVRKEPREQQGEEEEDRAASQEEDVVFLDSNSTEIADCPGLYLQNTFENEGESLATVQDLTQLTHLHEPSILQSLHERFNNDNIYTNTGPILLAVNPFKPVKLYATSDLEMYYSSGLLRSQGLDAPALAPHVFATGDAAYRNLVDTQDAGAKNQSILVSGESGAGKTESTKYIMKYLATVACDEHDKDGQKIADMVLQSNPILESFGNARTTRNDNSSRFGKFIEMQFNAKGMLVGARIVTYLLEKVRIIKQGSGERNFHVFYQLARGCSDEQRAQWKVPDLELCGVTNQSGSYDRMDGVEDDEQFQKMWHAMMAMGFPEEEREALMRTVSAVMNLGSLAFASDGSGEGSVAEGGPSLSNAAELLRVDADKLASALTTRRIKVGAEWFVKPLDAALAEDARDALCKSVYSRMFDRIVTRVNESIQAPSKIKTNFIGVLDIFGFEVFQVNSFEQLCINYANETLQQQFNQFVFKLEQKEYEKEKIKWSFIDFPDNQKCLDLVEAKPIGILSLLDEQCLFPQGSDKSLAGKFYEKLTGVERFSVSNREKVELCFTVEHYAGNVSYSTTGFIAKNKDQLYQESLDLMELSEDKVVLQKLFPKSIQSPTSSSNKVQSKTVSNQFREQLAALLKTIRSTAPHYVRCLKPNDQAQPGKVVRQRLVEQLRYGGVLEAVKVARAGYPVRMLLADFVSRYSMLSKDSARLGLKKARSEGDGKPACQKIVQALGLHADVEYQIGLTKLFLRKGSYEKAEEARITALKTMATRIQRVARGSKQRKAFLNTCAAVRAAQRVVRGMFGRRRADRARKNQAALRIQTVARSSCARKKWRATLRGVLRVQAVYRGYIARRERIKRKRTLDAAIVLQSAFRCSLARGELKKLRVEAKNVTNLQGKLEEMRLKMLEMERKEKDTMAVAAVAAAVPAVVEPPVYIKETVVEKDPATEAELARSKLELEEYRDKVQRLEEAFAASSLAAAAAVEVDSEEVTKLREALAASESRNHQLEAEVTELKRENEELICQTGQHIERMCDAENRANDKENELVVAKKANANLQDKIQAMETLHQQASGVKIALARRLESLILENRTLRQNQVEREEEVANLKQENQKLLAMTRANGR